MAKKSAGLLLFRHRQSEVEVLLAHPGGPFWAKKDDGAWSIPKGQVDADEDPLAAAVRECHEELGVLVTGDFLPLAPIRQPGGKLVLAWAVEADFDPRTLNSNTFEMEWPPRSGKRQEFPEIDQAGWFSPEVAKRKILKGQVPLVDELLTLLRAGGADGLSL